VKGSSGDRSGSDGKRGDRSGSDGSDRNIVRERRLSTAKGKRGDRSGNDGKRGDRSGSDGSGDRRRKVGCVFTHVLECNIDEE
jgi:hypothetical protein